MKKNLIVIFTLLLSCSFARSQNLCISLYQSSQVPDYRFQYHFASQTLSQKIRDNHLDYVYFTKEYLHKLKNENPDLGALLGKILDYNGWISGDNHSGNYIVGPMNGRLHYYFADIKDGGYGPLFYNFANLILNTHAVVKKKNVIKLNSLIQVLVETYLEGLSGKSFETPDVIKQALSVEMSDYKNLLALDVNKYVSKKGKFKFKKANIDEMPDQEYFETKQVLAREVLSTGKYKKILDYSLRLKDRGGSKNLKRFWVLVENVNNEKEIIEFKEVNDPAASVYRYARHDKKDNLEKLMKVYFPEEDPLNRVISVGKNWYMMRSKKVDLISVPYKIENEEQLQTFIKLAKMAAYTTGVKHSINHETKDGYLSVIEENKDKFQKLLKVFVKDYLIHFQENVLKGSSHIEKSFDLDDDAK